MTDNGKYKVLSTEYIHKAPWLTARKDKVQLPNGHVIPEYYVLEYPNWVCTIGITKNKEWIMIKQHRHGIEKTRYELCSGVCDDKDANPMESAKREMLEETGYGNGKWQAWLNISPNPSTQNNMNYCFLAIDLEKVSDPSLEPTEHLTVELLKEHEVKELLQNEEIINAMHVAPIWKYFAELK